MSVVRGLARNPLNWLLIFLPLAGVLQATGAGAVWVLATSALAMVPLAGLIGESTEALAYHTGPRLGGLLNATLGNAAELIISGWPSGRGCSSLSRLRSPARSSAICCSSWD